MTTSEPEARKPGPFAMERDFAGRQDVGARRRQEDFYAFADASEKNEPPITRLLVALGDGLGAHLGGNVASHHVVEQFIKKYKASILPISLRLRSALDSANESLSGISSNDALQLSPMGTTLLGCLIAEKKLWWISVGDSPFYLFRNDTLTRLNEDHSLAPMLDERVRSGSLTEAEALSHPDRHVLQSACIGLPLTMVDAHTEPFDLKSGDILIIASDGLLTLQSTQMEDVLACDKNLSAGQIADALIFAVKCAGHPRQDNTTIAVVKIP